MPDIQLLAGDVDKFTAHFGGGEMNGGEAEAGGKKWFPILILPGTQPTARAAGQEERGMAGHFRTLHIMVMTGEEGIDPALFEPG